MTGVEAENIINNYRKAIKDLRPIGIAQSIKDLPYTPGQIKYAYFIYGEELIKQGLLTKEIGDMLMHTYSLINVQFTEDFEKINAQYRKTLEGLKRKEIIKDAIINVINEEALKAEIEYNNFLADYQNRYQRNNPG